MISDSEEISFVFIFPLSRWRSGSATKRVEGACFLFFLGGCIVPSNAERKGWMILVLAFLGGVVWYGDSFVLLKGMIHLIYTLPVLV